MKKASVIIFTKNNENEIEELISALSRQNFKNFEVIIFDLCSTDRTLDKIKSLPIKIFRLESDKDNLSQVINSISTKLANDFIFCLGGNNVPQSNNFISSAIKIFNNDEVVLSFGPQHKMNEAPIVNLLNPMPWLKILDNKPTPIDPKRIIEIKIDNCAFRRSFLEKNNLPQSQEMAIWSWAASALEEGKGIYFNPKMAVRIKKKTGLISHLKEKGRINRLFRQFEEQKNL